MADDRIKPIASMHDITRFDSVGQRFLAYMRQLEQLTTEIEDYLPVLADNPTEAALKYVRNRLQDRLDAIRRAADPKEK